MEPTLRLLGEYIGQLGQDQYRPQRKWLWDMVSGIFESRSLMLSEIGRALREDTQLLYTEKRLSRNLNSGRLDEEALLQRHLQQVATMTTRDNGRGVVVAVDRTDLSKPYANLEHGMEDVCWVYDGSEGRPTIGYPVVQVEAHLPNGNQCPVLYRAFSYKTAGKGGETAEFLAGIEAAAPHVGREAWWVMDRGFDRLEMFLGLERLQLRWITRLKIGGDYPRRLADVDGVVNEAWTMAWRTPVRHQMTVRGGRRRKFRDVKLGIGVRKVRLVDGEGHAVGPVLSLLVVHGFGKEPTVLLASEYVASGAAAAEAVEAYIRRWKCEEATRSMKDSRGWGVRMEDLRALSFVGVRRLVLLATIAYGFVAWLRDKAAGVAAKVAEAVLAFGRPPADIRYRLVRGLGDALRRLTHWARRRSRNDGWSPPRW